MTTPWRDERTGIYYLRKRVPARFKAVAGKGELRKISLRTADRALAVKRWPEALEKWAEMERGWERLLAAEAITEQRAKEIAAMWAASVAAAGVLDMAGEDVDTVLQAATTDERTPENSARAIACLEAQTERALALAGVVVTPETRPLLEPHMRSALLHACVQGPLSGIRITNTTRGEDTLFAAYRATLPHVAAVPTIPPALAPKVSFQTIFERWKRIATAKPRTVEETRYIMEMLREFLGHDDAARVTREDVVRWRDATKNEGRTNNTWNNRFSMVRQVFEHAVEEGRLPASPIDNKLRLKKNRVASWLPYSDDEARRILEAARRETRPSLRWAHWIMAFTGMRVGEALQLRGADIQRDPASGIWFFDVNEEEEEQSVKNSTRRHVPMHPALVKEGFLDYAQGISAAGPLFPDKRLDKFGKRGGRTWNVVGVWVRKTVGITDTRKAPDHSWRHRVEDELRVAEVIESDRDAIVGHARKTTGRQYGVRGEALARLYRGLAKVPPPPGLV